MIGIRQLRADLAAHVRRAANGESTVITIGGAPVAALTPLAGSGETAATELSALIASGALIPPRRADGRIAEGTISTWANIRLDRLLREIRG